MNHLKHTLTIFIIVLLVLTMVPAQMFAEENAGDNETTLITEAVPENEDGQEAVKEGEDTGEPGRSG